MFFYTGKYILYRGYTGHEHIDNCSSTAYQFSLINMNGRFYDPTIGRMLSPDNQSQGGAQGFNKYSYCSNNPLKYTDPTGWVNIGGNGGAYIGSGQPNSAGALNDAMNALQMQVYRDADALNSLDAFSLATQMGEKGWNDWEDAAAAQTFNHWAYAERLKDAIAQAKANNNETNANAFNNALKYIGCFSDEYMKMVAATFGSDGVQTGYSATVSNGQQQFTQNYATSSDIYQSGGSESMWDKAMSYIPDFSVGISGQAMGLVGYEGSINVGKIGGQVGLFYTGGVSGGIPNAGLNIQVTAIHNELKNKTLYANYMGQGRQTTVDFGEEVEVGFSTGQSLNNNGIVSFSTYSVSGGLGETLFPWGTMSGGGTYTGNIFSFGSEGVHWFNR